MSSFILQGDCLATLRTFPDACIDSVVSDPPYGLSKEPDMLEVLLHWCAVELREHTIAGLMYCGFSRHAAEGHTDRFFPVGSYDHGGSGFMGKTWDSFVPGPEVWREVLRVLKPGGHAVVFSGTRTYDLTVLAMRIAGFEIRDQLAWMYGSGFPKNYDYAADPAESRKQGVRVVRVEFVGHPQADGYGTALKPAQEPIALARKPLAGTVAANVLEYGTGGINVDGCRIGMSEKDRRRIETMGGFGRADYDAAPGVALQGSVDGSLASVASKAHEQGRWPANVLLDEEAAAVLGDPSRFFYCAKTSKSEREAGLDHLRKASAGELTGGRKEGSDGLKNPRAGAGRTSQGRANTHPTVKPIALMRWLVRLVTPPGGVVLDPYAGSGSTGCAAALEGFGFVGCELQPEYVAIAEARIAHWREQGQEEAA